MELIRIMKKILVTGGAGYIGSHTVVELFAKGYQPIIMDNLCNSKAFILDRINKICGQDIPFYNLDCNDESSYQTIINTELKIDGVIHFAAYKAVGESVLKPLKYYNNNIGSLVKLLSNFKILKCNKIVFSSSCTVYGQPDKLPVTETSPIQKATSPYGYTKQVGEQLLKDSSEQKLTQAVILRYFNPIGAHTSHLIGELPLGVPDNLIPYITQTGIGIRDSLTVFGNDYNTEDGTCIRDFIHVTDLALAHIKAFQFMEDNPDTPIEYFNVGTGNGKSVLEIINAFNKASNSKLNFTYGKKREGDIEQIWAETSKANTKLNWQAEKSIEEALHDAWQWELSLKKSIEI